MDPHHRKIDLQSPADLLFLRDNIRKSAQEKLDRDIPLSAAPKDGEDEFRRKVEELVHQYINETLNLALPSLSINGLDASPSILAPAAPLDRSTLDPDDPTYEPFDAKLAQRVRDLHASVEHETTRSAELRREAPATAARAYLSRLEAEMRSDEAHWEKLRDEALQSADGGLKDWNLPRHQDLANTWLRARHELDNLKSMPRDVERLERALKAADEVQGD